MGKILHNQRDSRYRDSRYVFPMPNKYTQITYMMYNLTSFYKTEV